jgi:hypothetical protein
MPVPHLGLQLRLLLSCSLLLPVHRRLLLLLLLLPGVWSGDEYNKTNPPKKVSNSNTSPNHVSQQHQQCRSIQNWYRKWLAVAAATASAAAHCLPWLQVDFVQAAVIEFKDRPGKPCFCVEHLIEGDYLKYNSNSGYVAAISPAAAAAHDGGSNGVAAAAAAGGSDKGCGTGEGRGVSDGHKPLLSSPSNLQEVAIRSTPQAFSHFTYEFSKVCTVKFRACTMVSCAVCNTAGYCCCCCCCSHPGSTALDAAAPAAQHPRMPLDIYHQYHKVFRNLHLDSYNSMHVLVALIVSHELLELMLICSKPGAAARCCCQMLPGAVIDMLPLQQLFSLICVLLSNPHNMLQTCY